MESVIKLLFLVWLIINLIYSIRKNCFGKLGKWLHRYGWINEWSMYVHYKPQARWIEVYLKDFEQINSESDWYPISIPQATKYAFILNPSIRLNFFFKRYIKKLNRELSKSSSDQLENSPYFKYLCSVIQSMPRSERTNYRQIKVEEHFENGNSKTLVQSDLILLR